MRRRSIASDGRPPDLLAQPPSVRIQYFKDFAIAHPLLVEAKDRLLEAIMESAPNSIVIVLGPTGVGKTTLLAKLRQLLGATAAGEAPAEPECFAVVAMEATPPEHLSNHRGLVLGLFEGLARNRRTGIRPSALDTSRRQGLSCSLLGFGGSLPTLPIAFCNPESQSVPRLLLNLLPVAGDLQRAGGDRVNR